MNEVIELLKIARIQVSPKTARVFIDQALALFEKQPELRKEIDYETLYSTATKALNSQIEINNNLQAKNERLKEQVEYWQQAFREKGGEIIDKTKP